VSRLSTVLLLNVAFVAVLAVTGIGAHSIGVLAEGVDYIADAAAIAVALWAIWLSERPAGDSQPTRYPRATTWSALANGTWLFVLAVLVAVEAARRLSGHVAKVHGLPVLIVSAVAAITMLVGVVILRGDVDEDADEGGALNMRAVLLDTAGDAAAAGGVAVTGAVILATHLYWLDPVVALLIAAAVAHQAVALLRKVSKNLRRRPVS
jgi:cobalt-zinc-cadmium efflux system protein